MVDNVVELIAEVFVDIKIGAPHGFGITKFVDGVALHEAVTPNCRFGMVKGFCVEHIMSLPTIMLLSVDMLLINVLEIAVLAIRL